MNYWLSPIDSSLGLKYIEKTIDHIINIAGDQVLAIGTDFDGFTDPPDEVQDMRDLPALTMRMASEVAEGGVVRYDDKAIEKFLGGNTMRVLLEGWTNGKRQEERTKRRQERKQA